MWGAGADAYERIAERFAPIHAELVERLDPRRGERWLDLGTGTGAVSLLAAEAGAAVTALDIAPKMIEAARAAAAAAGLDIGFDVGDAQALPYHDASFDVVSSNFGVVFPPDRDAVAAEVARVCRSGGRLGLTAWRPRLEQQAIYERFRVGPAPAAEHTDWGDEAFLDRLLGDAFELEIHERVWYLEGDTPDDVYAFMAESAPQTRAYLERLTEDGREAFREAMVGYWKRFEAAGRVREPRRYLLVLGRRR